LRIPTQQTGLKRDEQSSGPNGPREANPQPFSGFIFFIVAIKSCHMSKFMIHRPWLIATFHLRCAAQDTSLSHSESFGTNAIFTVITSRRTWGPVLNQALYGAAHGFKARQRQGVFFSAFLLGNSIGTCYTLLIGILTVSTLLCTTGDMNSFRRSSLKQQRSSLQPLKCHGHISACDSTTSYVQNTHPTSHGQDTIVLAVPHDRGTLVKERRHYAGNMLCALLYLQGIER
jgi:hypothetical protein